MMVDFFLFLCLWGPYVLTLSRDMFILGMLWHGKVFINKNEHSFHTILGAVVYFGFGSSTIAEPKGVAATRLCPSGFTT